MSVFLRFRTNIAALDFYQTFNGAAYNSLEPDSLCHAVWVSGVEKGDDGLPPTGHTELPTCPGTVDLLCLFYLPYQHLFGAIHLEQFAWSGWTRVWTES